MKNRKFTKDELEDIENKYLLEIIDQSPFEKEITKYLKERLPVIIKHIL